MRKMYIGPHERNRTVTYALVDLQDMFSEFPYCELLHTYDGSYLVPILLVVIRNTFTNCVRLCSSRLHNTLLLFTANTRTTYNLRPIYNLHSLSKPSANKRGE